MTEWMSQMKLPDDIKRKLQRREVTREELMEFEDEELRSFCKDMHFNSTQTVHILKAVQILRSNECNPTNEEEKKHNTNNKKVKSRVVTETVFISQQEHQQYEALSNEHQTANKLIQSINNGCNSLDIEYNHTIQTIHTCIDELIHELQNKWKQLLLDIDTIEQYKRDGLQHQLVQSSQDLQHITKMRRDFEYFANDASMNRKRRTIKLQSMLNDIIRDDMKMSLVYKPCIQVPHATMNALHKYLNTLNISYCDSPPTPLIDLQSCAFDGSVLAISWRVPETHEFESNITGFEVYYTKTTNNKMKHIRYYEDMEDAGQLYALLKYPVCIWNGLQNVLLPHYLRKGSKGKIKEIGDDEAMDLLAQKPTREWNKSQITDGNKRKYKLKDLESNTSYGLKLRASNSNDKWSSFCDVLWIETPPLRLRWKYSKKCEKYMNPLTDARMIIESNKYGGVYRLYGDTILSRKMSTDGDTFGIEFIVHNMSISSYGTSIGFMSHPFTKTSKYDLCVSMHFGMNYIQIKCNGTVGTCQLNQWPWHKTRHGDSFIFVMDLHDNTVDAVYHNGVQLNLIFQQLYNQQKRVILPKKFVVAASVCDDTDSRSPRYYSNHKRKRKRKHVIGDIEIGYLKETDLSQFRMVLRVIWYVFVPWFIRVNIKFIIFMFTVLYCMWKYC
eukprot:228510_1